jgi:hypothetical protein
MKIVKKFGKKLTKTDKNKKKHQSFLFLRFESDQACPKRHNDNC